MTSDQKTVLWIGLIMVILNIVVHIAEVKSVIFSGPSTAGGIGAKVAQTANPKNALGTKSSSPPGSNMGNPTPTGQQLA